jgi:hypothetical protein
MCLAPLRADERGLNVAGAADPKESIAMHELKEEFFRIPECVY